MRLGTGTEPEKQQSHAGLLSQVHNLLFIKLKLSFSSHQINFVFQKNVKKTKIAITSAVPVLKNLSLPHTRLIV